MVRAVLVGCGAMSKAWLEAARDHRHRDRRPGRHRRRARPAARRRVRARRRRPSAPTSTRCSTQTRPDVVFDVVVPSARREIVADGARPRLPSPDRKAAGRQPGGCPRHRRRRRATRAASTPSSRTAAIVADVRRIRRFLDSGAIGAPTSIHCDFFVAAAFRRLPRGDAPRAAARHGDPHLRRGPLHGRTASRVGVYCREWEPARLLVPPGLVGRGDLRYRATASRLHLSRQLVRRRASAPAGRAPGASSASAAR